MGQLELQRELQRCRRQIVARNASIATADKREATTFKRAGDGDSQHCETLRCSIPDLPEAIWHHIHSLMPMHDAARAACLSRTFLYSWRCHPNLTLDWDTLGRAHAEKFNIRIDTILRNHSGIGLKILKLHLFDDQITVPYVDSWLQIALTPGIKELDLALYETYNFPCLHLSDGVRNSIRCIRLKSCAFHPTVELGPLRCLTSLYLSSVCITGDELESLLSNSLALVLLDLFLCADIFFLRIPCTLQQFSSLRVMACRKLKVIESKAPNLSYIFLSGSEIKFPLGEASQMKKLGLSKKNILYYARAALPSIMPNLETLKLTSENEVVNTPMLPIKFLYLKHLTISLILRLKSAPSYDYISLLSFLDASPSLETLSLEFFEECMEPESVLGGSSHLRQLPECRHDRLRSVKIFGFSSSKALVELTCCVAKNAVSLETLVLDTLGNKPRCSGQNNKTCWPVRKAVLERAFRGLAAIRTYIEAEVPPTAKLTVVEPCTRCHSC
ncbi:hypothetical protein ACP70R_002807 [Stipagrostis hirtigluma subsp. patula]